MDTANIKKYVDSTLDIYNISKRITEVKNKVKNRQEGADIVRSAMSISKH